MDLRSVEELKDNDPEKLYHDLCEKQEKNQCKGHSDHKIFLGICLSSQLIADVLGGKIARTNSRRSAPFPAHLLHLTGMVILLKYRTEPHG